MKYLPLFLFVLLCLGIFVCNGAGRVESNDYLRVHIRANSNTQIDQEIKYFIKDNVVDFITPYLVGCDSKQKSIDIIKSTLNRIELLCDDLLAKQGFTYKSKARLAEEYFPTRVYDNITLKEGLYDALIIELGEAKGDNWWCIVYPPLCFVNKTNTDAQNIQYQSYLMDVIKKYFG